MNSSNFHELFVIALFLITAIFCGVRALKTKGSDHVLWIISTIAFLVAFLISIYSLSTGH